MSQGYIDLPIVGFQNPMTTAGDMIYGGTAGVATRLPIGSSGQVLSVSAGIPAWATVSGTGTVTSVGVISDSTTDSIFANTSHNLTGSPVTTSGNITLTLSTQVKNKVLAGPTTGSDAAPAFRVLVGADLPNPSSSTLGGIQSTTGASHQWIATISTSGVPGLTQPAFTDISGSVAAAQLPLPGAASLGGVFSKAAVSHQFLTSISSVDGSVGQAQPAFTDISGTATAAQLPLPGAASLGGVFSKAVVSHQFLTSISSADGSVGQAQPAFTDISGSVAAGQMPALTSDVTTSAGAVATTVAKIQGTTVSGTTGTGNVAFSASPNFSTQVTFGNYHLEPSEQDTGNSGTTKTIDLSVAAAAKSTLTGSVTYTLTNPVTGGTYVFRIIQGASSYTVTWPATVKWAGGTAPVITTTNGHMDLITLYWDGTDYYGTFSQNYTP